jgi:hypothetical protein
MLLVEVKSERTGKLELGICTFTIRNDVGLPETVHASLGRFWRTYPDTPRSGALGPSEPS